MPEQNTRRTNPFGAMWLVMVVIGLVMLVRTISAGGGPFSVGVLFGILLVAAGIGRWYLSRIRRG